MFKSFTNMASKASKFYPYLNQIFRRSDWIPIFSQVTLRIWKIMAFKWMLLDRDSLCLISLSLSCILCISGSNRLMTSDFSWKTSIKQSSATFSKWFGMLPSHSWTSWTSASLWSCPASMTPMEFSERTFSLTLKLFQDITRSLNFLTQSWFWWTCSCLSNSRPYQDVCHFCSRSLESRLRTFSTSSSVTSSCCI